LAEDVHGKPKQMLLKEWDTHLHKQKMTFIHDQWRTEEGLGGSNPPRNSEVLTKSKRIVY